MCWSLGIILGAILAYEVYKEQRDYGIFFDRMEARK